MWQFVKVRPCKACGQAGEHAPECAGASMAYWRSQILKADAIEKESCREKFRAASYRFNIEVQNRRRQSRQAVATSKE